MSIECNVNGMSEKLMTSKTLLIQFRNWQPSPMGGGHEKTQEKMCKTFRDVVQSFGKIRYLLFIHDWGVGGGPGVLLGKLKYKIAIV